jgi:hypothetical protein
MIFVVVFQNGMDILEGETGTHIETRIMRGDYATDEFTIKLEDAIHIKEELTIKIEDVIDIKEEVSIKFEDAIHIKNEIPEAVTFPTIETEQEVSLWVECELVAAYPFKGFAAPERKL